MLAYLKCGMRECAHGQNAGSAADIEDNLVLEQVTVLVNGVAVAASAHVVLEHLLVNSMVVVAAESVSLGLIDCARRGWLPVEVVLLGVGKTGETVALLRCGCVVGHVCCECAEVDWERATRYGKMQATEDTKVEGDFSAEGDDAFSSTSRSFDFYHNLSERLGRTLAEKTPPKKDPGKDSFIWTALAQRGRLKQKIG